MCRQLLASAPSPICSSVNPYPNVTRTILEADTVFLATDEKCDRVLTDERYVFQIQDQWLSGCFPSDKLT